MQKFRMFVIGVTFGGAFLWQEYGEYKLKKKFNSLVQTPLNFDSTKDLSNSNPHMDLSPIQLILSEIWKVDFSWVNLNTRLNELHFDQWSKSKKTSFVYQIESHFDITLPSLYQLKGQTLSELIQSKS